MLVDNFQRELINWYLLHKRDLPWRKTTDPYRIWLSEIILQQTRVQQGLPYYLKFINKYPDVKVLADADADDVLRDWEGLGYYSRARNLHAAARYVSYELNGNFPTTYKELIKIKGVGDYTASAISSFAANEARPVIDGNVIRVVSRLLGISDEINSSMGKKRIREGAEKLFFKKDPAIYNQAIMEFGAMVCVPVKPECGLCPHHTYCNAFQMGLVSSLPVKNKKTYKRQRYFHYLIYQKDDKIAVEKRKGNDIWQGLYQFPLKELSSVKDPGLSGIRKIATLPPHTLSHQQIHITIWLSGNDNFITESNWKWISSGQFTDMAFPRPLRKFLDLKALPLQS